MFQTMSVRLYLTQPAATQMFRLSSRSIHLSCQANSSKWKFPKLWSGKTDEKTTQFEEIEKRDELEEMEKQMSEYSRETEIQELKYKRNKSKLRASDRQILQGLPPDIGLKFPYGRHHLSKEFRRGMLAQYGSAKTGVDPAMSWPTDEELRLASDWEKLYQEKPLAEQISQVKKDIQQRKADRIAREEEIEASLSKMDSKIKQWQQRVSAKNKLAEVERDRRERVLAELKEEFGYNVNPQDNYMKERIAEREKALIKEERDIKKALKKEKQAGRENY